MAWKRQMCIVFLALFIAVFALFSNAHSVTFKELVIVGTGSGTPLLKAIGKAFTIQHPDVSIVIPESIGSGGAIKAVGNDEYVLGRVARDIQDREKRYGLVQTPVAKIPIVFFVNDSVSSSGITADQACNIFNGTIRRWEEIGGGKGKIRVIKREDGDSSLRVLQGALPGFGKITLTPKSKTTYTDQETVDACKMQKNAIAFGSLADVRSEKGIHVLELDGLAPTGPRYPYTGFLSMVYKEKNFSGDVKKFIEFISSDIAGRAISSSGGLQVK